MTLAKPRILEDSFNKYPLQAEAYTKNAVIIESPDQFSEMAYWHSIHTFIHACLLSFMASNGIYL